MLPLTGLGGIVFVAWYLDKESVRDELGLDIYDFSLWNMITRFLAPVAVLVVFFTNL